MEKGEGDGTPDDGIVSEDLTLLVEHIDLTSPHRLPEAHEWELATPTPDLDDSPILIGEVADDDPELDSICNDTENTQIYTETQADLNQLLTNERRRTDQAAALPPSARAGRSGSSGSARTLERDQLLAERERRIDELQAGSRHGPSSARAWPMSCANRAR